MAYLTAIPVPSSGYGAKIHSCISILHWFLKPARLGISSGRVDDNGNVTIPGQAGQTYDIILWLKGYEPVVVKNVTCPANIGTQQSSGKNETLLEIFEDHRR